MNNFKYFLEDHKKSIFSVGSIVAGVSLVAGIFVLINVQNHKLYNETKGPEVIIAKNIIVQSDEGDLDLYNVKGNEKKGSLDIGKNTLVNHNQEMDTAFVYDKDTATLSEVKLKNEKMSLETIQKIEDKTLKEELSKATQFKTTNEEFAFLTPNGAYVINETDRVIKPRKEHVGANELALSDSNLYLANGDSLYAVDLKTQKQKTIEIGDKTTELNAMGNYIMAHNQFGKGINKSMALRIKKESLKIEELKQFDTTNYINVTVPSNENQLVMLNIKKGTASEQARKELIVMNAVGATSKKEEDKKENKPFVMTLAISADFNKNNTIASNGYLYNKSSKENRVSITELRNGREYRSVSVDSSKDDGFFMPVYKK